jgi:cytochrome c oxidase subunit IV
MPKKHETERALTGRKAVGLGAPRHGSGGGAGSTGEHNRVGHISSAKLLTMILFALLFLTVVTVGASMVNFGAANLFIALLIAMVKATIVVLYFMHMRYDRPLIPMVLIGSMLFVTLFLFIAMLDTSQYEPDMIPGYAPKVIQ